MRHNLYIMLLFRAEIYLKVPPQLKVPLKKIFFVSFQINFFKNYQTYLVSTVSWFVQLFYVVYVKSSDKLLNYLMFTLIEKGNAENKFFP